MSSEVSTPRIEVELPPFFLNQTRWKTVVDCERLYGWIYVEGLVHPKPVKNLAIGGAIHQGMVLAHESGRDEAAFAAATSTAVEVFKKQMGPAQLPSEVQELQDGESTIRTLLPAYRAHYASIGELWKPLGQELKFCVEVGEGTNVWLVGRLDNLAVYRQGLWVIDYKTMSKLDMREFIKYEIDIQLTCYVYGATKQLTLEAKEQGKPAVMVRGAIIDGLIKTKEPQFHREIYTRTIEDLRNFELEFCMKSWELAAKHALVMRNRQHYDALREKMWQLGTEEGWKTVFPKNTNHCFRYRTCTHRDLCVKDTETRRLAFDKRPKDYVDEEREKRHNE